MSSSGDRQQKAGNEGLFRPEAVKAMRQRMGSPVRSVGVVSWLFAAFLLIVFVSVVGFLVTAKYARKETVIGTLEPAAGALRVVASHPGVISAVHVKEGDLVAAGTPIATITLDQVLEGGAPLGRELRNATELQASALRGEVVARRSALLDQMKETAARRDGLLATQARLAHDLELQSARVKLARDAFESLKKLHEQHYVSEVLYRQREDTVLQAEQQQSAIQKNQDDVRFQLSELAAQTKRIDAEAAAVQAQLAQSGGQLDEKRANLAAQSQIVLTAPTRGRIVALQARAGAPISQSATVATVVPEGTALEAELWAPSKAAGFVRVGDEVRLMYDAYPYQRFGAAKGRVVAVATAPTLPNEIGMALETKESMYRVTVALDRQTMAAYGRIWALTPGSRLSADLILESRTFAQWLLDPLRASERRAGT